VARSDRRASCHSPSWREPHRIQRCAPQREVLLNGRQAGVAVEGHAGPDGRRRGGCLGRV
jgi:hypothetical protein